MAARWWRRRFAGSRVMLTLFILLVLINLLAGWIVVSSAREARTAALEDMRLQAAAAAESVAAALAGTRADLQFLSQSAPMAALPLSLDHSDPMVRRWRRLDIDSTLLLFLAAHPEVDLIKVRSGDGVPLFLAGWRDGAPVLLAVDSQDNAEEPFQGDCLLGRFELAGTPPSGTLEAVIDIGALIGTAVHLPDYILERRPFLMVTAEPDRETIAVAVEDPDWSPPIHWTLLVNTGARGFPEIIGRLQDRYRGTLIANLLLILLVGFFGVLSIRQARLRAQLEVENRKQNEIRELERQLLHSERLAGVGRLAAGLAHEINNPLEGMGNYLSVLESELTQEGRQGRSLDLVRRIRYGLDRTASVTRQVLAFAEPEGPSETPVDLSQVLQETVDFIRSSPEFKNRQVDLDLPPSPMVVPGNPVTLGQLFLNLILNAVEMQSEGGEVSVQCRCEDGSVSVRVVDRGPGIPEEVLDRIFDPFFSGRGSTGLGLSICKGIVRRHGGTICARNRAGGGAVLEVSLPLVGPTQPTAGLIDNETLEGVF
jgi:signal transduction histidine kinase